MASILGTPAAINFGSAQNPAGQAYTVESGANTVVAFFAGYSGNSDALATVTLAGATQDELFEVQGVAGSQRWMAVARWHNPPTGSQTLDPAFDTAQIEGACCVVASISNAAAPAWRDADGANESGATPASVTLNGLTAGDLVMMFDALTSGSAPGLPPGFTNGQTQANINAQSARMSYIVATGATQACTSQNSNDSGVVAIAIADATVIVAGPVLGRRIFVMP